MIGRDDFAVFAVGEDFTEEPEGAGDGTNDAASGDGFGDHVVSFVICVIAAVAADKATKNMEFYVYPIEVRLPFGFERCDGGVGDTIEAQGAVVGEFGDVLVAVGFFAPALEVEAFFDREDLGMADAEAPGTIGGVVVGETEGGVAADVAIEGLSPRCGWVVEEVLQFGALGDGEFAAGEQQFGEDFGVVDFAGIDE